MPSQFTIRLVGLDTLQTGMGKFSHALAPVSRDAIKEAMHRALVRTLSGYSQPQRGYQRTGNLFHGTNVETDGYSVRIRSSAYKQGGTQDYSGYVLGTGDGTPPGYGQAAVHRGYWIPARQAVDEQVELLTTGGEMEKALDAEIAKDGL